MDEHWRSAERFAATGIQSVRALQRAGVERWLWELFRPRDAWRLTRGVWVSAQRLPSATLLVAHVLSQLAARGAVGLRSAAALHGLLEAPEVLEVVMPRGAWRTQASWPFAHRRFTVACRALDDHVLTVPMEPGLGLRVTTRERTVLDLLRFRRQVGEGAARSALRRFLDTRGDEAVLAGLARQLRVSTALARALKQVALLAPLPPVRDCRPLVYPTAMEEEAPPLFPRAPVHVRGVPPLPLR
ncbi:MAG: type IV toxin-antitoxin system AbiEi family antitoxin [Myxococcota bacterium]